MERAKTTIRDLENRALGKATISDLLSALTPEEFEVLWDLSGKNLTISQIARKNDLSVSQVNTLRSSLARKATALLL